MTRTLLRRAIVAVTASLATVALAAGCSGTDSRTGHSSSATAGHSSGATAGYDSADVMFAQMMIPHHRQAVEMADLAPQRAGNPTIRKLADQIRGAQDPEIRTMTSWLKSWGEPVSSQMKMGPGEGIMSDADMAKLKAAKGKDFDMMFARMMIAHHKGAISMARTELKNGRDTAAKKLAGRIIRSQSAEITTLQKYSKA